jgi:hypothetical protein
MCNEKKKRCKLRLETAYMLFHDPRAHQPWMDNVPYIQNGVHLGIRGWAWRCMILPQHSGSTGGHTSESEESLLYRAFQDTKAIERDPVSKKGRGGHCREDLKSTAILPGSRLDSQYPHSDPQSSSPRGLFWHPHAPGTYMCTDIHTGKTPFTLK